MRPMIGIVLILMGAGAVSVGYFQGVAPGDIVDGLGPDQSDATTEPGAGVTVESNPFHTVTINIASPSGLSCMNNPSAVNLNVGGIETNTTKGESVGTGNNLTWQGISGPGTGSMVVSYNIPNASYNNSVSYLFVIPANNTLVDFGPIGLC